jgi:hypothetical protein
MSGNPRQRGIYIYNNSKDLRVKRGRKIPVVDREYRETQCKLLSQRRDAMHGVSTSINYEAFRVLKMDIPDVSGKPDIETPAM